MLGILSDWSSLTCRPHWWPPPPPPQAGPPPPRGRRYDEVMRGLQLEGGAANAWYSLSLLLIRARCARVRTWLFNKGWHWETEDFRQIVLFWKLSHSTSWDVWWERMGWIHICYEYVLYYTSDSIKNTNTIRTKSPSRPPQIQIYNCVMLSSRMTLHEAASIPPPPLSSSSMTWRITVFHRPLILCLVATLVDEYVTEGMHKGLFYCCSIILY